MTLRCCRFSLRTLLLLCLVASVSLCFFLPFQEKLNYSVSQNPYFELPEVGEWDVPTDWKVPVVSILIENKSGFDLWYMGNDESIAEFTIVNDVTRLEARIGSDVDWTRLPSGQKTKISFSKPKMEQFNVEFRLRDWRGKEKTVSKEFGNH